MLEDIVLIILSYKRPKNIAKLIIKFKNIIPIIIINNNPEVIIKPISNITIINNNINRWCIERWRVAKDLSYKYAIILDDDIDPSIACINTLKQEIEKSPDRLVSIYGKNGVTLANDYKSLDSYWCEEAEVEIVVGACIAVSIPHLKLIWDNYLSPWGFQDRGDDIQVSLSMSDFYKKKHKVIKTEVSLLDEGDVGLNKHPSHFSKRWEVIQNFSSPFTASKN